ncbi:hypothetical protein Vadar_013914 [Vaccinium darrowii]|uniref:Uncharacterized protein n=1 Tax=Vaccinium darrowii TaxID=229202 RepID=A0ACB7X0Q4_9ERIC|nr:hypothetical protein Vadar_013914 [Vaccinium darrowii]
MAESDKTSTPVGTVTGSGIPNPVISTVPNVPASHMEKPEKFNGTEFKRWQQKMLFYLTTLNLASFLTEDAPALKENETDRQDVAAVDAWKQANMAEQGPKDKKRKHPGQSSEGGGYKKFKGKCYKYDKEGHRARDCRTHKGKENANKKPKHAQANLTESVLAVMLAKAGFRSVLPTIGFEPMTLAV